VVITRPTCVEDVAAPLSAVAAVCMKVECSVPGHCWEPDASMTVDRRSNIDWLRPVSSLGSLHVPDIECRRRVAGGIAIHRPVGDEVHPPSIRTNKWIGVQPLAREWCNLRRRPHHSYARRDHDRPEQTA